MYRLIRLALACVGCLFAACLSLSTPASADDYIDCQGGEGVCGPDDYIHYYCYGDSLDGKPSLKAAVDWVMDLMDNQTVMTSVYQ